MPPWMSKKEYGNIRVQFRSLKSRPARTALYRFGFVLICAFQSVDGRFKYYLITEQVSRVNIECHTAEEI